MMFPIYGKQIWFVKHIMDGNGNILEQNDFDAGLLGGVVVSQREGSRFNSQLVLSVYAWVLSGLPPTVQKQHVRLIGVSKMP